MWLFLCSAIVLNTLQNPGFEEVGDDGLPIGWRGDAWGEGASFGVSKETRSGRFSAFIRCPERNDARLIQRVKLKPHSIYRLSAWVRTEDVRVAEKGGDVGANIGVYGTFVKSEDVKGRRDGGRFRPSSSPPTSPTST